MTINDIPESVLITWRHLSSFTNIDEYNKYIEKQIEEYEASDKNNNIQ